MFSLGIISIVTRGRGFGNLILYRWNEIYSPCSSCSTCNIHVPQNHKSDSLQIPQRDIAKALHQYPLVIDSRKMHHVVNLVIQTPVYACWSSWDGRASWRFALQEATLMMLEVWSCVDAWFRSLHSATSLHFHRSTQAKTVKNSRGECDGNRLQLHRPCNDMRGSWQDSESLAAWLEAEREATLALSLAHQDQICLASPSTSHWYTLMQIDSCIGRWPQS